MKLSSSIVAILLILSLIHPTISLSQDVKNIVFIADPATDQIDFFWRNQNHQPYESFSSLSTTLQKEGKKVLFITNGGMFHPEGIPVGLYIEKGMELNSIDLSNGKNSPSEGNFYMRPDSRFYNGVFYITKQNKAFIVRSSDYKKSNDILYGTQSGPMLLVNGVKHPNFIQASPNKNIRNGVGILPDGKILFVYSENINFWEFAEVFLKHGCKNALYLDGAISGIHYPEKNISTSNGSYIVMIAVTKQ